MQSFNGGLAPDGACSEDDILDIVSRDKAYYFSSKGGVTLSGGEPFLQDSEGLVSLLHLLKRQNIHVAVETSLHAPWAAIQAA